MGKPKAVYFCFESREEVPLGASGVTSSKNDVKEDRKTLSFASTRLLNIFISIIMFLYIV